MAERPFDVFLSHSRHDKDWVEKLKHALVTKGLCVWLDKDEIRPGNSLVGALERGIGQTQSVALVVSPEALRSGWVHEEYAAALAISASRPLQIIPVILAHAELPPFLASRTWVDFRDTDDPDSFMQAVNKLIWGITGSRKAVTPPHPLKRSVLLDRRWVSDLMMLLSSGRRASRADAAFLLSIFCVYDTLFFENFYGSSLHALSERLDDDSRSRLLALPELGRKWNDWSDLSADSQDAWVADPTFTLALAQYDRLKGGSSAPTEMAAYLAHTLYLARHFDLAIVPYPNRWPLYERIFVLAGHNEDSWQTQPRVLEDAPPGANLNLSIADVALDAAEPGKQVPLPAALMLHQYQPMSYPVPPAVVSRYEPEFLQRLTPFQFELVTPANIDGRRSTGT